MDSKAKAHFLLLQHVGANYDKVSHQNAIEHALITVRELISYSEEWDDSEYFEEVEKHLLNQYETSKA